MAINNRELSILKARLTVNRINVITSSAPDETLELLAKSIQQSDSIQVFCDIMDTLTENIVESDLKVFF